MGLASGRPIPWWVGTIQVIKGWVVTYVFGKNLNPRIIIVVHVLEMADLIKGAGIAEDEINGALNKAITEIVNAVMIIKRVLTTIKTTIVKRSISP